MAAVHRETDHKGSAISVACSGESSRHAMDLVVDLGKSSVQRNADCSVGTASDEERGALNMDLVLSLNQLRNARTPPHSRPTREPVSRTGDLTVSSLASEANSIYAEENSAGLNLFPTRRKDSADVQEMADVENAGVDLQRPRALVQTVENWRKSSGRIRGRPDVRMRLSGSSFTVQSDSIGADRNTPEQRPQSLDIGVDTLRSGKLPVDCIDTHSRSGRNRLSRARHGVVSGISIGVCDSPLAKSSDKRSHRFCASSSASQFHPRSSSLELRCGSSSSTHVHKRGGQHAGEGSQPGEEEEKDAPGDCRKSGDTKLDLGDDCFLPVPGTHGASFSGRDEETMRSSRRASIRKRADVSDDEDDGHPGTSLTLGLHPRLATASPGNLRETGLGERNGSGKLPVTENNTDSRRSKRKRDVGRMGLAVGSALADVEMLPEVPNTHVSFPIKRTRLSLSPDSSDSDWEMVDYGAFRSSRLLRGFSRSGRAQARLHHQTIRRGLVLPPSTSRPTVDPGNVESIDLSDPVDGRGAGEEIDQPQGTRAPVEAPLPTRPRSRSDHPIYRDFIDLEEPGQPGSHVESDRSSPNSVQSQWGRCRSSPSHRRWLQSRSIREGRQLFFGLPSTLRRNNEAGSSRSSTDGVCLLSPDTPRSESSVRRVPGASHPISLASPRSESLGDDDLRILESIGTAGFRPSFRLHRRRADRARHHALANPTSSPHGDTAEEDTLGLGDLSRMNFFSSYMRDDIDLSGINADSENTDETLKALQVAEDERLAIQLQASFALEAVNAVAPNDESYARVLQAEEDTMARDLRLTREIREARGISRADPLAYPSAVQGYLGDLLRETHIFPRRFRGRPESHPSFSRVRPIQHDWSRGLLSAERRFEVMTAMEVALRDHPTLGLQLAGVDRDFDENDYEMLLALDSDIVRNEGASLERISQLPLCTIQATEVCDQTCSICLEFPVVGDIVRRLPCIHVFHQGCIDQWLQRQAVCPVCKAHI